MRIYRLTKLVSPVIIATLLISLAAAPTMARGSKHVSSFGPFAGYAWLGPVTSVSASWKVPNIQRGSSFGEGFTWIGVQGTGDHEPFIQIGTAESGAWQHRQKAPRSRYFIAWSDTRHHYEPQFLCGTKPGDVLSASIALATSHWILTVVDKTSDATARVIITEEPAKPLKLAVWFQEDVSDRIMHSKGVVYKQIPYPLLNKIHVEHIAVNGISPSYNELYSTWMSSNDGYLAPSPLHHDSFVLKPATIRSAGARYLQLSDPIDTFLSKFATSLLAKASHLRLSRLEHLLVRRIHALTTARWPRYVKISMRTLISRTHTLLHQTQAPIPPDRDAWISSWMHDLAAASSTGREVRRILGVPELTPKTYSSVSGVAVCA